MAGGEERESFEVVKGLNQDLFESVMENQGAHSSILRAGVDLLRVVHYDAFSSFVGSRFCAKGLGHLCET